MKETVKHALFAVAAVWVTFLILDIVGQSGLLLYPYTYFTKGSAQANS
jgi:hypothetical protein